MVSLDRRQWQSRMLLHGKLSHGGHNHYTHTRSGSVSPVARMTEGSANGFTCRSANGIGRVPHQPYKSRSLQPLSSFSTNSKVAMEQSPSRFSSGYAKTKGAWRPRFSAQQPHAHARIPSSHRRHAQRSSSCRNSSCSRDPRIQSRTKVLWHTDGNSSEEPAILC